MAITLEKLCRGAESVYGMKLLAGTAGLAHFVRWVHMVEDRFAADFMHGNELVFTTGIGHGSEDWLLDFVRDLCSKNACGLVVNVGPYLEKVPPQVIVYCEQHDFPIFTVPWSVRLIDITYDFCHRIVASEESELGLATALRNLIFQPEEPSGYRATLERRSFPAEASYRVVAIDLPNQEDNLLQEARFRLGQELSRSPKAYSLFLQDHRLIGVMQDLDVDVAKNLCIKLQKQFSLRVGLSAEGVGYHSISDGYRQAIAALQVSAIQGQGFLLYSELGVYKLLLAVENHNLLRQLADETLGTLELFDQKNHTDYLQTLRYYLECDSSVQQVAQMTFVHRNTINYKIKRIREILGYSFTHEQKLRLALSFYIRDLLKESA